MGVMKRIQGWRDSRWPIPNTLQMLAGLIPYRDPELFAEKKKVAREGERERAAIQAEGTANRRFVYELRQSLIATGRKPANEHLYDLVMGDPDLGKEPPVRAADGWYRFGSTFYRLGQGPFAEWGIADPPRPDRGPAMRQQMLF